MSNKKFISILRVARVDSNKHKFWTFSSLFSQLDPPFLCVALRWDIKRDRDEDEDDDNDDYDA